MFDLEMAIAEWRREMLAGGIKSPEVLDELEAHLRTDFEQQMQSEGRASRAFAIAVEKIGRARELKKEFKKAGAPMEVRFVTLAGIACVAVALFCQLRILLPILFNAEISFAARIFGLAAVAATALAWRYNHKFLPVIRSQAARMTVGFAGLVGCFVWTQLFLLIFPRAMQGSISLVAFLWGSAWLAMAVLGGLGHGLEKAVRSETTTADF
jgi:hypothetical protein